MLLLFLSVFFFKQKTAYEMRISDWSSDVCSSDLLHSIMKSDWKHVVFNGVAFKYDPVHDPASTKMLVAKPGERVRVYFVNAGPNEYSTLHPIAGIWDAVYPSGNPKNKKVGMQSMVVGPGDGATFDIVSPVAEANVIVDHRMSHAHSGAMAVLM